MSRKSKGINAERELIHKFWQQGWAATRVAGSGSSRYPSPDIIAGRGDKKIAIECKSSKEKYKYITKEELIQLKAFSEIFGAEPWIAVRFNNTPWYFIKTENLEEKGASFLVDLKVI